jgi:hypothetical protein
MYGTTREDADSLCALANEQRIGFPPARSDARIVRYEVRAHSWHEDSSPRTWGVWPVWEYNDRPDLGANFGGPFMDLSTLRDLRVRT